jgi:hypothetical protein
LSGPALAAPEAPLISHQLSGLNVTASWNSVPGATGYLLSYAPFPYTGPAAIGTFDLGAQTSISVDLWEGASFYIAVQAYDNSGLGAYSNIDLFAINNAPAITSSADFILKFMDAVNAEDSDGRWQAIIVDELLSPSDVIEPALGKGDIEEGLSFGQSAADPELSTPQTNPDGTAPAGLTPAEVLAAAAGQENYQPAGDYWFAFIDLDPLASFEHPTLYVYGDAASGEIVIQTQGSWPLLNGTDLYVTDKSTSRLFPAAPSGDEIYPNPSGATDTAQYYYLITPDYTALQASTRLLFQTPGATSYLNLLVDNNSDGIWTATAGLDEWLLKNIQIEPAAGWTWTPQFQLPLDDNNKFGFHNWTRLAFSPVILDVNAYNNDGWTGQIGLTIKDAYFNFLPWGGLGYGAAAYDVTALGPWEAPPPTPAPPAANEIDSGYLCIPDELLVPTKIKALVINLGDSEGNSWMQRNGLKAKAGFELLLGDGVAQFLDRPTKEQAMTAVTNLFTDMKCLDEVWLYVTGHGESTRGSIKVKNGNEWFRWSEVFAKLDAFTNCPTTMDFYQDQCRQAGYCNVNMIIQSCYSGHWQDGYRWGVNILTSADKTHTSFGRSDGNGSYVSNEFWNGHLGLADQTENGGNGDGVVSNQEAMLYARDHHEGPASNSSTSTNSNCNCICENYVIINEPPVANAGYDQEILVGESVFLSGAASHDPEGAPLDYRWELTSKPADSNAVLIITTSATPIFTCDVPGTYVFSLVVSDGLADSVVDTVQIVSYAPVVEQCPEGTSDSLEACNLECGNGSCYVQETAGASECYACQSCGSDYFDYDTCLGSCAGTCEVNPATVQGDFFCYQCVLPVVCADVCASYGYFEGTDHTAYVQSYLEEYSCVSGASISLSTATINECSCSLQPTIVIDQTVPVCEGSPCGDVLCGETSGCTIGETTYTVSCNWGGWLNVDENLFVPIVGGGE